MINEDGLVDNITSFEVTSTGAAIYPDEYDPMNPSASTVLRMMESPELTHKGEWLAWVGGVFISLIAEISILFADEVFRWGLVSRVRYLDQVEPSDWAIVCNYIGWTLMSVIVFAVYITGLQ